MQTPAPSPGADHRPPGRTYAIPFERVWGAALALATESPRWSILRADDQRGVIFAEASGAVLRRVSDVTVRIGLDADAQTRVDLTSRTRKSDTETGGDARRITRFLRELDRRLEAAPDQILAPPP